MSQDYTLTGTIIKINETQEFDSGFCKREFIVDTGGEWPQQIKFECVKDNVTMLDQRAEGDEVTVHFNIRGNEYNDRYYVDLQAWRMALRHSADEQCPDPDDTQDNDDGKPF